MSNTSGIETRELSDDDLEGISGGLSVGGSVNGLAAKFDQGPNGVPVLTDASVKSISANVSDIELA